MPSNDSDCQIISQELIYLFPYLSNYTDCERARFTRLLEHCKDTFRGSKLPHPPLFLTTVHYYLTKPTIDGTIGRLIYNTDKHWKRAIGSLVADPGLFHLGIIASAIHLGLMTKEYNRTELIFHKIRVIQLVNERLQQCNQVTDSIILIVANLANVEV